MTIYIWTNNICIVRSVNLTHPWRGIGLQQLYVCDGSAVSCQEGTFLDKLESPEIPDFKFKVFPHQVDLPYQG